MYKHKRASAQYAATSFTLLFLFSPMFHPVTAPSVCPVAHLRVYSPRRLPAGACSRLSLPSIICLFSTPLPPLLIPSLTPQNVRCRLTFFPRVQWWGPPQDGPHTVLWSGRTGDPHGHQVDPGLLDIEVSDVVRAIDRMTGEEVRSA